MFHAETNVLIEVCAWACVRRNRDVHGRAWQGAGQIQRDSGNHARNRIARGIDRNAVDRDGSIRASHWLVEDEARGIVRDREVARGACRAAHNRKTRTVGVVHHTCGHAQVLIVDCCRKAVERVVRVVHRYRNWCVGAYRKREAACRKGRAAGGDRIGVIGRRGRE